MFILREQIDGKKAQFMQNNKPVVSFIMISPCSAAEQKRQTRPFESFTSRD